MSGSQPSLYDAIHETVSRFMNSYSEAEYNFHGPSALSLTLSPDCKRYVAPSSFLGAAAATRGLSNAEYEAHMTPEFELLETWRVETKNIVVDERKRSAVAWSDSFCTLKGKGEFKLEFMYVLEMNEMGDKVDKIVSFIDTAECMKYMEVMKEVVEEQKGK